ncbi:MAG TPA: amidohydrolase [Acidobacteriota bacterium]|nr:amidohydrolase [Acidobacteriota bacterium]
MSLNTDHINEVRAAARRLHRKQVTWRRHLHMHPELSFEEFETTKFLKREIRKIGLRVLPLKMKTGVLAELSGRGSGPTVAIRADIDALPVHEQTGLSFRSRVRDRMHACGHDVHTATALGAAALLSQMRDRLNGNVRFIFQPAEEQPPGGALAMIENGALKGVSTILGAHVDPDLPTGKISLRDGVCMGAVYDFDLIIHGRGGHAARPHTAVDALVAAAEVVGSLQTVVSRKIDPIAPAVITFGQVEGGRARNTIPDRVRLVGTARTLSEELYRKVPSLIKRTASGICRAHGATCELKPVADYPVLRNDPGTNRLYERNYRALFGDGKIVQTDLVLGGEDFARYLQKVPGAMFRLGIRNRKIGADKPWHSPEFMADEDALVYGTSLFAAFVLDLLGKQVA